MIVMIQFNNYKIHHLKILMMMMMMYMNMNMMNMNKLITLFRLTMIILDFIIVILLSNTKKNIREIQSMIHIH